jgi:hypothetical protein
VFFPAFYQPRWVIEGLATYYESRLTGAGRAYGSSFDMLLNNDADAGDFRTIDAADGLAPIWPAGNAPYAYGGFYFRDIAEQRGDSAIANFARRGAARLPYTLNWAAPDTGVTLTGSWNEWSAAFETLAAARADSLRGLGLTVGVPMSGLAWSVSSPRYSPDGSRLAFTYITPRDDPATAIVDAASGALVRRSRRNGSGTNTWARDGQVLYLNQVEFAGRYEAYSDLYTLNAGDGAERRLTRAARYSSPDLSPDGQTMVAVETREGTNRLVLIDSETMETRPLGEFAGGVNWEHPRWSPDGRRIAAERWLEKRIVDLVVLDRQGEVIWQVTRDEASDVTPAWSPDGRFLVWASDRDGAFDIYAVDAAGNGSDATGFWRVTRSLNGASDPDVSPDGRWMAYTGLYPEGVRVERIAFDTAAWEAAGPNRRSLRQPVTAGSGSQVGDTTVRSYSPFPSLWPKSWFPLVFDLNSDAGTFIGVSTFGTDDIRRHSYGIVAGWRTGVKEPQALAAYSFAGFGNPVLQVGVSQDWDVGFIGTTDGNVLEVVERERRAYLAANFLRPRRRNALTIAPIVGVDQSRFAPTDTAIQLTDSTFTDLDAGLRLGYSTARGYPRSVSREKGWSAFLDLRHERWVDDWDSWRVSAETILRGYMSFPVFGYSNHVIAARLSAGTSDGHERSPEIFELGGVPGRSFSIVPGLDIGGGSRYAVRGYEKGVLFGDRIVSGSLEYRFPLALVGRGYGLWPIFLDRLSGSFFFDAGSAWFDADDITVVSSVGAELSVDLGLNYSFVYRFRLGLAIPLESSAGDPTVYLTAGVAY